MLLRESVHFSGTIRSCPSFLLPFGHYLADWLYDNPACDSLCEGSHQMELVFAGDWHRTFPSLSIQSNGFQCLSDLKSKEGQARLAFGLFFNCQFVKSKVQ